jgi:hypothetical protein
MLDPELFGSIASHMMASAAGDPAEVAGTSVRVRRTASQRLKTLTFTMNGREYTAIEQNQEKPSRWGQLARSGHQVVQFKDNETNRFVAVAVDGKVRQYGRLDKRKAAK